LCRRCPVAVGLPVEPYAATAATRRAAEKPPYVKLDATTAGYLVKLDATTAGYPVDDGYALVGRYIGDAEGKRFANDLIAASRTLAARNRK
jgi:hypothetical protein